MFKVGDVVVVKSRNELARMSEDEHRITNYFGGGGENTTIFYDHYKFGGRRTKIKTIQTLSDGNKRYYLDCSIAERFSEDMFDLLELIKKKDFKIKKKARDNYLLTDSDEDEIELNKEEVEEIVAYKKDGVFGEIELKTLDRMINIIKNGEVIAIYKKDIPLIKKCLK